MAVVQSLADELRAEFPGIATEQPRLTAAVQVLRSGFWRSATLTVTDRAVYAAWIERGALRCLCLTGADVDSVGLTRHRLTSVIEVTLRAPGDRRILLRASRRPPLSAAGWGLRGSSAEPGADLHDLERALRTTLAV